MKIFLKMTRYELPDGEGETVFEGQALLNGGRLLYAEKDKKAKQTVLRLEDQIVLQRVSDVSSLTRLYFDGTGQTTVSSPFGDMLFHAELLASEFSEKEWSVTYRLFTEQGTVTEQKIVWELKKFN